MLALYGVPLLLATVVIVFEAQHRDPSCAVPDPNRPMGACGGEYPPGFLAAMLAPSLLIGFVVSMAVAPPLLRSNLPGYVVVLLAGACGMAAGSVLGTLVLPVLMLLGVPI